MSLSALKRKTEAKYGNHSNTNGFSLNGTSRYPSYIGRGSARSVSGVKPSNICCAYNTNEPDGFKTVKNYNTINKHGRLTRWYKEDYTQKEWNDALNEAGLSVADYPYPTPGTLQKIQNNWVQQSNHGDGSSHIYTYNKKQTSLKQEFECNQRDINNDAPLQKGQCNSSRIFLETGTIRHQCVPITKDIAIGKDASTSLSRITYQRGALNPTGYSKPFPYNTNTPGYRACKENENQVIDAVKNGYFSGQTNNNCDS
jgi:hypothetical protein